MEEMMMKKLRLQNKRFKKKNKKCWILIRINLKSEPTLNRKILIVISFIL